MNCKYTIFSCLCAAFFFSGQSGATEQLHIRVDLYDVPNARALAIQQGVSLSPDQTGVVGEVNKMVDSGEARFVSSVVVTSPVGARAKFEDTEVVMVVESFEWNEEVQELVPKFGQQQAGTIFEVDPGISDDGEKLDVNFALEHHTAPPVTEQIVVPLGKTEKSREVSVPRFFRKKITTRIQMPSGTTALVGAFEITGTDNPEDAGFKRLAFLYAEAKNDGDGKAE